ncbi:MAG: type II secretion system GspH family protein [Candidatus Marinimicrobia bacterium]|nr:type II secretion system GspH family protein [Candidatus Neomarinimicrobiota bacterium]
MVELLVVIAIIGLLMALVLPSLSSVRDKAVAARFQSNQRQVCVGLFMLANDRGGRLPGYVDVPNDPRSAWWALVSPYINEPHPVNTPGMTWERYEHPDTIRRSLLHDPADRSVWPGPVPRPIRNNAQNGRWLAQAHRASAPQGFGASFRRLSHVRATSQVAMLVPGMSASEGTEWAVGMGMLPWAIQYYGYDVFSRYRSDRLYCAFIDGHVQGVDRETVLRETSLGAQSVFWDTQARH